MLMGIRLCDSSVKGLAIDIQWLFSPYTAIECRHNVLDLLLLNVVGVLSSMAVYVTHAMSFWGACSWWQQIQLSPNVVSHVGCSGVAWMLFV